VIPFIKYENARQVNLFLSVATDNDVKENRPPPGPDKGQKGGIPGLSRREGLWWPVLPQVRGQAHSPRAGKYAKIRWSQFSSWRRKRRFLVSASFFAKCIARLQVSRHKPWDIQTGTRWESATVAPLWASAPKNLRKSVRR